MPRSSATLPMLALAGILASGASEATQRVFVASHGSDSNVAINCTFTNPCRSFQTAMSLVDSGGEVVALDAAGYGIVSIQKSVTITANPGFYASIAVPDDGAGTAWGIVIGGIGVGAIKVTLRGLHINGIGGGKGVWLLMAPGASLSIENCVISNLASDGVHIADTAIVRIINSVIRDNAVNGVLLEKGATASIADTKILGNGNRGVFVSGNTTGATTSAILSDSVVSGHNVGVYAYAPTVTAAARMIVTRSAISNGQHGVYADNVSGTTVVTVGDSKVAGNAVCGLCQFNTAVLESLGNNTVRQNAGGNTQGTITTVPEI